MKSNLIVLIGILFGLCSLAISQPFNGRHGPCKCKNKHHTGHQPHLPIFHDPCKCRKSPYDVIQPHQSYGLFGPACGNKNCQHCGLFGAPANYDNNGWGAGALGCDNKKPGLLGLPFRFPTLIKAGLGGYIVLPGQVGGFNVELFKID